MSKVSFNKLVKYFFLKTENSMNRLTKLGDFFKTSYMFELNYNDFVSSFKYILSEVENPDVFDKSTFFILVREILMLAYDSKFKNNLKHDGNVTKNFFSQVFELYDLLKETKNIELKKVGLFAFLVVFPIYKDLFFLYYGKNILEKIDVEIFEIKRKYFLEGFKK